MVNRRTILKGIGASLTLPFLPSLAWAADPTAANAFKAPKRWAMMMFANGVWEKHWWQKTGSGDQITELSKTLQPLAPFTKDLLFLNNLHIFDNTVGVHTPYFTNILSAVPVSAGSIPKGGESIDHLIGRMVGKDNLLPMINLGCHSGGTTTWSSPTTPVPPEVFPKSAFNRLFDTTGLIRDRSVLDFVHEQAKSLQKNLDYRDSHKLQEYMTSIREIEKRIEFATSDKPKQGWQPSLDKPDMDRPEEGVPRKYADHVRLQLDIMLLGLQMDKTRVVNFMFQKDTNGQRFDFIKGVGPAGMHTISHHRKDPKTLEEYQKINQWHVEQLAYVIKKMKAVEEGDGSTLFDNCMTMFLSSMMDGDVHDANKLPLLIAGGKNCGIKGGRSLTYTKLEDRRLCNLHLNLAQKMGCKIDSFSNSHYPLPGV